MFKSTRCNASQILQGLALGALAHGPLSEAPASPPKAPTHTTRLPMALRANRSPGRALGLGTDPVENESSAITAFGRRASGPCRGETRRRRPKTAGNRGRCSCMHNSVFERNQEPFSFESDYGSRRRPGTSNKLGSVVVQLCKEDCEAEQVGRLGARDAGSKRGTGCAQVRDLLRRSRLGV